jgi:hypothetical protein
MGTLTYFGNASIANDWQGMVDHLKKANQEYRAASGIMTPYERQSIGQSIAEKREQLRPTIEAGALAVWEGAKANLKAALANVEAQRRKATNSWDDGKLAPIMQVYSMRIDQATKADAGRPDLAALQAIYAEAKDSGDRYKIRAAAEALQGVVSKIPAGSAPDPHGTDARMIANGIAKRAGRDLEALKTSPELTKADELAAAKTQELNAAKSLLYEAAEPIDGVFPNGTMRNSRFIKALESVTQDDEGSFVFKE